MGLTLEEKNKLNKRRNSYPWRTFVHITNGNNKFWKIRRIDYVTTETNFGSIDSSGQTIYKDFDYSWETDAYITRKIHEKIAKGYKELK